MADVSAANRFCMYGSGVEWIFSFPAFSLSYTFQNKSADLGGLSCKSHYNNITILAKAALYARPGCFSNS